LSSDFAVPDWYKSHMVNLVSKVKVWIELMVRSGRECYCYKCSSERCVNHFYQYGEEEEYDIEDLREVYFLLDWLSCQFCFQRPLKTKNLVFYGLPKTTKFKIHMLSSAQAIKR
jgi:hypothetical protein